MKGAKVTELRPSAPTLGACRHRLEANGYRPVSALMPFGITWPAFPPILTPVPDWMVSEHPAAILCAGSERKVAAFAITWPEDATLAGRMREMLAAQGLLSGPVRIGSDGVELRPLRLSSHEALLTQSALGLSFDCTTKPAGHMFSHLIPLDGKWEGGSLLEVPYAALAEVTPEQVKALLSEVQRLPWRIAEERRPPPAPAKKGWLGR